VDFELNQAELELEELKIKLNKYLLDSYGKSKDPGFEANNAYKHLEEVVNSIVKRQAVRLGFSAGAAPAWYIDLLPMITRWVELEVFIGETFSEKLDSYLW